MTDIKKQVQDALDGYDRAKSNNDLTTWFSVNEHLFTATLRTVLNNLPDDVSDTSMPDVIWADMADLNDYAIAHFWHVEKSLGGDKYHHEHKLAKELIKEMGCE